MQSHTEQRELFPAGNAATTESDGDGSRWAAGLDGDAGDERAGTATASDPSEGDPTGVGGEIHDGDVRDRYHTWPAPTVIVSDGAYGTGSFPGEPPSTSGLVEWYEPHVEAWTERATPGTTLWVWNTEIGWATIHPLIEEHGWSYRGCNIWNKGLSHIAGNSNTETMRKFPQVTEVCVQYVMEEVRLSDGAQHLRNWLREEWQRAGLTVDEADEACGVRSAASRKYLANDEQWYFPPPEMFERLRAHANEHGDPDGRPYLVLPGDDDGETGACERGDGERTWSECRPASLTEPCATFNLRAGVTNVWDVPQLGGEERVLNGDDDTAHLNQKPLSLMERVIRVSSERADTVWVPFAGTGTAAVAAKRLGRVPFAAERVPEYHALARERIDAASAGAASDTEQASFGAYGDGGGGGDDDADGDVDADRERADTWGR